MCMNFSWLHFKLWIIYSRKIVTADRWLTEGRQLLDWPESWGAVCLLVGAESESFCVVRSTVVRTSSPEYFGKSRGAGIEWEIPLCLRYGSPDFEHSVRSMSTGPRRDVWVALTLDPTSYVITPAQYGLLDLRCFAEIQFSLSIAGKDGSIDLCQYPEKRLFHSIRY